MISDDRICHIIAVARFMKDYCLKNNYDLEYCQEMFTLGLLHDIGYEFSENKNHSEIGASILERQNYKYSREIKYHGLPNCEYSSNELNLLNWADMHIDSKGNYVSYPERLKDIEVRRGKNSSAYINCEKLIEKLLKLGLN